MAMFFSRPGPTPALRTASPQEEVRGQRTQDSDKRAKLALFPTPTQAAFHRRNAGEIAVSGALCAPNKCRPIIGHSDVSSTTIY
jgi:hypothetical protein